MPILAGVFDPLAITVVLERKEGAVWRIGDGLKTLPVSLSLIYGIQK